MQFNKIRCASRIAAPQRQDRIEIPHFILPEPKAPILAHAEDLVFSSSSRFVRVDVSPDGYLPLQKENEFSAYFF
jgi:hypothetical protein